MPRVIVGLALAAVAISLAGAAEEGETRPLGIADIPPEMRAHPAVVLEDRHYWNVVPARRGTYRFKRRIAVLDRRGFEHADQIVFYDAYTEKLESFSARTLLPDGRVVEVPADLRHELVALRDEATDLRSIHFTFPAVEVGAVLEWSYTLYETEPPLIRHWDVQGDIPVLWSRFLAEIKQPSGVSPLSLHAYSRIDDGDRCDVLDERAGARSGRLEMVCRNVPAHREEPLSPPGADSILDYLVVWSDDAYAQILWTRKSLGVDAAVTAYLKGRAKTAARAAELVREGMSDQEKVDAVYGFVKNEIETRNVYYAPRQKGRQSTFQSVDEVLESGGGLPGEVTILTLALLRAAGLKAEPVLVQDRSEGHFAPNYPDGSQLDRLMLRVNVAGKASLLDPSCRYCPAGTPDWRYCGSVALRLGQLTPVAFQTGIAPALANFEKHEARARVATDGTIAVEGRVSWAGQYDVDLRTHWHDLSPAARREELLDQLPGDVRDTDVELADPDAFFEELSARYRYTRVDLPPLADGRLLVRPADVFSIMLPIPLQEQRTQPLSFRYPYSVRAETVFELPDGFEIERLPGEKWTLSAPGLEFESAWKRGEKPGEVVWAGLLTVDSLEIAPGDYAAARDFTRRLRLAVNGGFVAHGRASSETGP